MTFEPGDFLTRRKVPEPREPVLGPGRETSAVRREGDAGNLGLVPFEPGALPPCREIPEPRGPV